MLEYRKKFHHRAEIRRSQLIFINSQKSILRIPNLVRIFSSKILEVSVCPKLHLLTAESFLFTTIPRKRYKLSVIPGGSRAFTEKSLFAP
jgi:hypothetical protein